MKKYEKNSYQYLLVNKDENFLSNYQDLSDINDIDLEKILFLLDNGIEWRLLISNLQYYLMIEENIFDTDKFNEEFEERIRKRKKINYNFVLNLLKPLFKKVFSEDFKNTYCLTEVINLMRKDLTKLCIEKSNRESKEQYIISFFEKSNLTYTYLVDKEIWEEIMKEEEFIDDKSKTFVYEDVISQIYKNSFKNDKALSLSEKMKDFDTSVSYYDSPFTISEEIKKQDLNIVDTEIFYVY